MRIKLHLNTADSNDEIVELNDFLKEQNMKGLISKIEETKAVEGTMGVGDYLPVLEIILSSTVVAAGVKGLFEVFKNYFDLKRARISTASDLDKLKIEQRKVEFSMETADGKKVNVKFSSFDSNERKQFFDSVDKVFNG